MMCNFDDSKTVSCVSYRSLMKYFQTVCLNGFWETAVGLCDDWNTYFLPGDKF